jgi:glucosamine 6-phosphate synthetase-like amidotransferase/phosphosugar isomerase protein
VTDPPLLLLDSGAQPLVSEDGNLVLCVNGEIYNHLALKKLLKKPHAFQTHSDCEVIMHLVSFCLQGEEKRKSSFELGSRSCFIWEGRGSNKENWWKLINMQIV